MRRERKYQLTVYLDENMEESPTEEYEIFWDVQQALRTSLRMKGRPTVGFKLQPMGECINGPDHHE